MIVQRLCRTGAVLSLILMLAACSKPQPPAEPKAPVQKAMGVGVDSPDAAAPPPVPATGTPAGDNNASTTATASEDASPPPADMPIATSEEIAQFNPMQPMNAYAKRGPGDYQAQLDLYNKVLRTWASRADRPPTFKDLMATYNSPKPPEPPPGRKLVYDPKTITVRLE
jgi:hypothetical protein